MDDKKGILKINGLYYKWSINILVVILIFLPKSSFSCCSCDYAGDFLEVAPLTDFVGLVKILGYSDTRDKVNGQKQIYDGAVSMTVEIVETYLGKDARKTIIVHGDEDAMSCKVSVRYFDIGEYYVLSLFQGGEIGWFQGYSSNIKFSEYYISNCGEYWLKVDTTNSLAKRDFRYKTNTNISLKELELKLQEQNNRPGQLHEADLIEVFQHIFSNKKLKKHFNLKNDNLTNQMIIEYFPDKYVSFDKAIVPNESVKIYFKEELANKNIEYYFEVKYFKFFEYKGRKHISVDLLYHGEDTVILSHLIKRRGKWRLKTTDIYNLEPLLERWYRH